MTRTELYAAIRELLEARSPESMSAGEITSALNAGGADVRRNAVKSACDELAESGDINTEPKRFFRNGDWRSGTAYHRRPRPLVDPDEDPFELFDRRMP